MSTSSLQEPQWAPLELTSFDAPAVKTPRTDAVSSPPIPSAAELRRQIQELRETAQARGHAEGYAAGHAQGLESGLKAGTEQGQKEGHAQGYKEGLSQGLQTGSEQANQACKQLDTLVSACANAIASLEADVGQSLITLAIQLAKQVLRSTLADQPEKILDLIDDLTHTNSDQDATLTLRLNPEDQELVRQHLASQPALGRWRLVADASITRGGCITETAEGDIDATLETRWQRVIAALGHNSPLGRDS